MLFCLLLQVFSSTYFLILWNIFFIQIIHYTEYTDHSTKISNPFSTLSWNIRTRVLPHSKIMILSWWLTFSNISKIRCTLIELFDSTMSVTLTSWRGMFNNEMFTCNQQYKYNRTLSWLGVHETILKRAKKKYLNLQYH